jgi:hypothetical protein
LESELLVDRNSDAVVNLAEGRAIASDRIQSDASLECPNLLLLMAPPQTIQKGDRVKIFRGGDVTGIDGVLLIQQVGKPDGDGNVRVKGLVDSGTFRTKIISTDKKGNQTSTIVNLSTGAAYEWVAGANSKYRILLDDDDQGDAEPQSDLEVSESAEPSIGIKRKRTVFDIPIDGKAPDWKK